MTFLHPKQSQDLCDFVLCDYIPASHLSLSVRTGTGTNDCSKLDMCHTCLPGVNSIFNEPHNKPGYKVSSLSVSLSHIYQSHLSTRCHHRLVSATTTTVETTGSGRQCIEDTAISLYTGFLCTLYNIYCTIYVHCTTYILCATYVHYTVQHCMNTVQCVYTVHNIILYTL